MNLPAHREFPPNRPTSLNRDANGNLLDSEDSRGGRRRLCWTENNYLQAFMERGDEGGIAAWYNYSADGERNLKLTSPRLNIQQNATLFSNPPLVYPTLYASSLVTLTKQGYTKHYFEEGRRICSKIGGGMHGNVTVEEIDSRVPELTYRYDEQFHHQYDGIRYTFSECIEADPQIIDGVNLHKMLIDRELRRDEDEPTYFYHSDHLGSAAYLTHRGSVIQTLNYLPYGEDWVELNFFAPHDTTRLGIYRFNGKEKDYESGFHYYGARYYWSELLTGWLSVDPMSDKYPSISPYAYCAWNPVKLVDPDGNDWYEYKNKETNKTEIRWTNCHNQNELDKSNINGRYLGVTVDDGKTYYGLMGDIVNKADEGERYRLVKDLDQAIIYRALASSTFASKTVDFSDVFTFEYGAGSNNSRAGYSYAGGVAGIAMNNKRDLDGNIIGMNGRFNDMKKLTGRSLSGPLSLCQLDAPRFSINGVYLKGGKEIAAISFAKNPSKADRFEKIYEGLKGRPLMRAIKDNDGWKQTRYE